MLGFEGELGICPPATDCNVFGFEDTIVIEGLEDAATETFLTCISCSCNV